MKGSSSFQRAFTETYNDSYPNTDTLLEDLAVSVGGKREGYSSRVLEKRETPTMKHTTTEYTSPDQKTRTRTERYEYHSSLPQQNGTNQKIVQHSSMMYHTNRSDSLGRSSSLNRGGGSPTGGGALTRSESLNRSESLRRRARDPSPDLRLRFNDDIHYSTPPPPQPTQRLKQNIVELDTLLHDLNAVKTKRVAKSSNIEATSRSWTPHSNVVTSEGTQTDTDFRPLEARIEPISHSTPHQHRKEVSSFSSSYSRREPSPTPIISSYKSYESSRTKREISPKRDSDPLSRHTARDPSPVRQLPGQESPDPSAKTIIKNYHYYYTLDGNAKPGFIPEGAPKNNYPITSRDTTKSYHYSYTVGPDGVPVISGQPLPDHGQPIADRGQPLPDHSHPIPDHGHPIPDHGHPIPDRGQPLPDQSPKTVVTHRAYNYSWSSQGQPITNGHPSPHKPDRYYVVDDGTGKLPEPAYTSKPVEPVPAVRRPGVEKPKPFPLSNDDDHPPESTTTTNIRTYQYSSESRKEEPSEHHTYNYWSYPGQPSKHPSPPTQPATTKPPKKLDDLMATFSDIEDAPPTPPAQRKPIYLQPANETIRFSSDTKTESVETETAPLVQKKSAEAEKSVNKAGSPVYYPPSYSDPKPLRETPKQRPQWMMEMEREKMKGKYKHKESERKSEFKAVPMCIPLCCAAPLCCEIM